VAIDPHAPPGAVPSERAPAIENEIPTYRAIHPLAVLSLVLGILSVLSFANQAFVVAGVLAILTGVIASRTIQRLSDVLTGRGLAQAGIALGLVFSLSAVTIGLVQSLLLTREVQRFAGRYCQVLARGNQAETLFWSLPPAFRAGKTPEEALDAVKKESRAEEFEMRYGVYKTVLDRLATPGQTVQLDAIEAQGVEGVTPFATVRLRLNGSARPGAPAQEAFALLLIRADPGHGRQEWYVEDLRYPYQPSSYTPAPKPVDDGHGHGH
jgi:Domain of unknown function (DUF4190)